jgi:hypothetical protein
MQHAAFLQLAVRQPHFNQPSAHVVLSHTAAGATAPFYFDQLSNRYLNEFRLPLTSNEVVFHCSQVHHDPPDCLKHS